MVSRLEKNQEISLISEEEIMDLTRFFIDGDINGLLDPDYIQSLKDESKKQFEKISRNWKIVEDFYDGNQWISNFTNGDNEILLTKINGDPVYGTVADLLSSNSQLKDKMPRRTVNKIKNYVEALVASFVEVDPQPHAVSASMYYANEDVIHQADLWYNIVFNKENQIKHLYENAVRTAIKRTYCIYQIVIDENHAKTEIPVKFRYIDNFDFMVDPLATSLDEADYVIQKISMRYKDLKENYDYVWEKLIEQEPDDFSMIDIDVFWIRWRKKDYSFTDPESMWVMLPVYKERRLNIKKGDKVFKDIKDYVYKTLPFVMFKTMSTEYWHCDQSIIVDAIESQIDYNKTISERDYNWNMVVDPPATGKFDVKDLENGNKPGGNIPVNRDQKQWIEFKNTSLLDTAAINNRLDTVDNEIAEVFGTSKEIMQGRKPEGTYSDKLMQTLIKLSQLKPKRMEDYFLDAIKIMADKAMILWADYMGTRSILVFDADYVKENEEGDIIQYGRNVKLDPTTIRSTLYTTDVEIKDANLLTPEAKFKNLTDLMQYGGEALKNMAGYEYFIFVMANNAMNGFVPDELLKPLHTIYKASVKKAISEAQTAPSTAPTAGVQSNAVQNEIQNVQNELIQAGVWDKIKSIPELGEDVLQNAAQGDKDAGLSDEEIIKNLRQLKDKLINIDTNTQQGA